MKTCRTCGVMAPLDDFYKNPHCAGGHDSACKSCCCLAAKERRRAQPDVHAAYERARYVGARKQQIAEGAKRRALAHPDKRAAHVALGNAVRDRRVSKPDACGRCLRDDVRIEGHHRDYAKPLEVEWLCCRCHRREHAELAVTP